MTFLSWLNKISLSTSFRKKYLALLCLATLLFAALAVIVYDNRVPGWELNIFHWFNHWQAPEIFKALATIASDFVWGVVILVALSLFIKKLTIPAWRLAVAGGSAYVTVFVAEHLIGRARPEVLIPQDVILRASQDGMGFPSGHVATITAIFVILRSEEHTSELQSLMRISY